MKSNQIKSNQIKHKIRLKIKILTLIVILIFSSFPISISFAQKVIKFTSPRSGDDFKPGEEILFRWEDVGRNGKKTLTISYYVFNDNNVPIKTDTVFFYEEDNLEQLWQLPCEAVTIEAGSITGVPGSIDANLFIKGSVTRSSRLGNISVYSKYNDYNLPPIAKNTPFLLTCGTDDNVNLCIQERRKKNGSSSVYPEDRYIKWYGINISSNTIDPISIINNFSNGVYGELVAEGVSKLCLNKNERNGYQVFVVTADLLSPNCLSEKDKTRPGKTSAPGVVYIQTVPNLTDLFPLPSRTMYLRSDDDFPCAGYFDCKIPGSFYDLPKLDGFSLSLGVLNVNNVDVKWYNENTGQEVPITVIETPTGDNLEVYRVCYDDINTTICTNGCSYKGEFTISGTYLGQPFSCTQSSSVLIRKSNTPLDPIVKFYLDLIYEQAKILAELSKTYIGQEVDPCYYMILLYEALGQKEAKDSISLPKGKKIELDAIYYKSLKKKISNKEFKLINDAIKVKWDFNSANEGLKYKINNHNQLIIKNKTNNTQTIKMPTYKFILNDTEVLQSSVLKNNQEITK